MNNQKLGRLRENGNIFELFRGKKQMACVKLESTEAVTSSPMRRLG